MKFKKYIIAGLLIAAVLGAIFIFSRDKIEIREMRKEPIRCYSDDDCMLYNCTSCGNKLWIDQNAASIKDCDKQIPGLLGCVCVEGICKRQYKK